nr:unnamed protein product [Callosobruchus analis]
MEIDTNKGEKRAFLAVNLLMGIKKLPSYRDYWSSMPELRDHFINQKLPSDRFIQLLGHFHLNDNSRYHSFQGVTMITSTKFAQF